MSYTYSGGILTSVSVGFLIFGFCLLVVSPLFLNDWREIHEHTYCYYGIFDEYLCKRLDFFVTAASLGIIASIFQMGSVILVWRAKIRIFFVINILIFVSCLVALSLALDTSAHRLLGSEAKEIRGKIFIAIAGIDMFYSGVYSGEFILWSL